MPAAWRAMLSELQAEALDGLQPTEWQEQLNDAMEDGSPAALGAALQDLKAQGITSDLIGEHLKLVKMVQQMVAGSAPRRAPAGPPQHRESPWLANDPAATGLMGMLTEMQKEWVTNHPQSSLILKQSFPTTRSDALKIKFSALDRFYKLLTPEGRSAFEHMNDRFPMMVTRTVAYLLLNYVAQYRGFFVQQGRHLCVIKCYMGRNESHVWFMPLDKVKECLDAQSDSLRQGISHNDLQLVQTYPVRSTLAIHAETWQVRSGGGGRRGGGSSFGEISWIGGNALHYATEDSEAREASQAFAQMSIEEISKLSTRKQRIRERGRADIAAEMADEEAKDKEREEDE